MEFKLNFEIRESLLNLTHKDSIVLIGSCFSDEMAFHFQESGLNVLSNPFGTVFHPMPILNEINASLFKDEDIEVYHFNDLFFSWNASGKIYGHSEDELRLKILNERDELYRTLKEASLLVLTFGTSKGYRNKLLNTMVANCHKAPIGYFQYELSEVQDMYLEWSTLLERLKEFNPGLRIIFTVSPVRHKKDGLIENNQSKARLIELVHQLSEKEGVDYFPSYEILIVELRDYRFYANDLVHPSKEAVRYIWDKFEKCIFSKETQLLSDKVRKILNSERHVSLYPESENDQRRIIQLKEERKLLLEKYPEVYWYQ